MPMFWVEEVADGFFRAGISINRADPLLRLV